MWVEFLLRLYSLVETDNLALAGNILALPRERVAPRKAGPFSVAKFLELWRFGRNPLIRQPSRG